MAREITQRQLRNESGGIMRGLDRGETYVVTRNGVPVGELRPIRRGRFVSTDLVLGAFASAPPMDARAFREDLDRIVGQEPAPRG